MGVDVILIFTLAALWTFTPLLEKLLTMLHSISHTLESSTRKKSTGRGRLVPNTLLFCYAFLLPTENARVRTVCHLLFKEDLRVCSLRALKSFRWGFFPQKPERTRWDDNDEEHDLDELDRGSILFELPPFSMHFRPALSIISYIPCVS